VAVRVAWAGVDRDALLSALEQRGLEPRVTDHAGEPVIEIPCEESDVARLCDDVMAEVETLLAEQSLPLVPERDENRVFVRPPAA
jgi:hypothetical protein